MQFLPVIHAIRLDPSELSLVKAYAQRDGQTTAAYATIEEFRRTYQRGRPGCVVLNLGRLTDESLAALEHLRQEAIYAPIVVICESPATSQVVHVMQKGAFSVLEKPLSPALLEDTLNRALHADEENQRLRAAREMISLRLSSLNAGERDVLERLMAGMANKNIAAELQLGLRTVELRRAKILRKLGAKSLAQMVRCVLLAEPERFTAE